MSEHDANADPDAAPVELTVTADEEGQRLDVFLSRLLTEYSRTRLRRMIDSGDVIVDGRRVKVAYRLLTGQRVTVTPTALPPDAPEPEDIPLDVLFEDESLVAVNKPPGMVVHPSKGHWSGTLASGLAFRFSRLSGVGGPTRPGIVHRLDRDTSGVIVIAKNDAAHLKLAEQFERREVEKEYFAVLVGAPDRDRDEIDQPIGAHPYQREKMAIRDGHPTSRQASTFYEILERFDRFAAVRVVPKTGRTHQIRVHLAGIGCPVLCDRQYGGRSAITRGEIRRDPADETVLLDRQALHSRRLKLMHPDTGEPLELAAPLPDDLTRLVEELKAHRGR